MAPHSTSSTTTNSQAHPFQPGFDTDTVTQWIAQGIDQGVKPEQALAFIGLGLMRRMVGGGQELPWIWTEEEEEGGQADLTQLRQRLELTQMAIQTGAPLSTAEVTQLLGARPAGASVCRGGLTARRLGRNVWKLSRSEENGERGGSPASGHQAGTSPSFPNGFRRRL